MSSSTSVPSSTTVKLYFSFPSGKQEIRRFTAAAPPVLPALLSFLSATYERRFTPPLRFAVAYDDGEDLCSVSSEAELQEGLQLHAASGAGGVFKLLCSIDNDDEDAPPKSPATTALAVHVGVSCDACGVGPIVGSRFHCSHCTTPGGFDLCAACEAKEGHFPISHQLIEFKTPDDAKAAAKSAPTVAAAPMQQQQQQQPEEKDVKAAGRTARPRPWAMSSNADLKSRPNKDQSTASSSSSSVSAHKDAVTWLWGESAAAEGVTAATAATASASASSSSPPAVHGVKCDVCGVSPIVGSRFHCSSCTAPGGSNLCAGCEATEGHFPLSHQLVEFKTPEDAKMCVGAPSSVAVAPVAEQAKKLPRDASGGICTRPRPWATTSNAESAHSNKDQSTASSSSVSAHKDAVAWLWGEPTAVATASGSASSSSPLAVHVGISCGVCGVRPIVGSRFHCLDCTVPANLCAACEAKEGHFPLSHQLVEFKTPEEAKAVTAAQQQQQQEEVKKAEAASSSSVSAPAAASSTVLVHRGVTCDGCRMSPLIGNRYHCTTCTAPGGFDLCEACEQSGDKHPSSHLMMKMRTAASSASGVAPVSDQLQAINKQARIVRAAAGGRAARPRPWAMTSTAKSSQDQSTADSSSSSSPLAVHIGASCSVCGVGPIVGTRFHCSSCTVDLCAACEATEGHFPISHQLIEFKFNLFKTPQDAAKQQQQQQQQQQQPVKNASASSPSVSSSSSSSRPARVPRAASGGRAARPRPWVTSPAAERPKAQFLSDVTCADGMQVRAGETLRKTWSIKNVGPAAWPTGVRLVFAGGDLAPESEGLSGAGAAAQSESGSASPAYGALVPFAGPGDVVHVSIDIVVPQEEGRFRGTFRLQTKEGDRFGPRIWIDLTVPPAAKEEEVVEKEPAAKKEVEAPAVVAAAAPAPAPVAAVPASAPVSASAASAPAAAPTPVPAAVVAVESKQREEEKIVASSSSAAGPVLGAGAWGRPVRTVPLNNSAAESALAAEFSSAHISPSPAAAAAAAAAAPISIKRAGAVEFQYSNQLAVLRSMGFVDKELCKYLLINNRGDLEKVVQWLLANAAK